MDVRKVRKSVHGFTVLCVNFCLYVSTPTTRVYCIRRYTKLGISGTHSSDERSSLGHIERAELSSQCAQRSALSGAPDTGRDSTRERTVDARRRGAGGAQKGKHIRYRESRSSTLTLIHHYPTKAPFTVLGLTLASTVYPNTQHPVQHPLS